MKWLMLVFLFHLICSKCNKIINIASQDHLLQLYLCHHYNYTGNTTLLLLDTLYNISGNGSMCNINTNYSLTIQGNHSMAIIQCISSTYVNTAHPNIGFAFMGSNSLTLQRVTIIGCGANLTTLDKGQLNIVNSTSSLVYFTQYHAAVLVFTEISHLVMKDVSISQYYGFAIVAVNLPNATLDSINVINSRGIENTKYSVGCGVLLLFKKISRTHFLNNIYKLDLLASKFIHNYDYIFNHGFKCGTNFYNSHIHQVSPKPVINAAGLTILYTQNDTSVHVTISQCTFKTNIGSIAGAILILHVNTIKNSKTLVNNHTIFGSNGVYRECHGSGIVFIFFIDRQSMSSLNETNSNALTPIQVVNVIFRYDQSSFASEEQHGIMYMAVINAKILPLRFKFSNVNFKNNQATSSPVCVFAASYPPYQNKVYFVMESVVVSNTNSPGLMSTFLPVNLFQFSDVQITIKGSSQSPSIFVSNYGTVIEAIRSDITLEGHIVFHNNTGISGAAIMLRGDSVIYLTQGLQANFTHNKALSSGGAIYALTNTFSETYCTFQVNTTQYDDIAVLFENNKATVTGNSIFSSKVYNCYISSDWINSTMARDIYNAIFTILSNDTFEVSTTPVRLTICNSHNSVIPYSFDAYPGQTISLSMAAIDAIGHHSYSIVTITAVKKTHARFIHINWWFSERENTQVISESDYCTLINVTIHTNDSSLLLYQGNLLFTIPSITNTIVVTVNLKSCPPGFELNSVTGSCVCSPVLLNIDGYTPNCSINTRTFNRPIISSWIGSVNNTSAFLLSLHCHHGFCNTDLHFSVFHYQSDGIFELMSKDFSQTSSLCFNNRDGILCSSCPNNYSVVFGSTECRECSNWWLWILVLYAVAGPLLIYLLYALRLTLTTGTLNGIIFYAQVSNAGLLTILSIKYRQCSQETYYGVNVAMFFLSMLNLNLGFPLCFYNGMTELWKAGLSLLFPLYLLTIVVVLIILSRFSLRLSSRIAHSSVQVMITVIHLSFTKLLLALFDVFTPVQLYRSNINEPLNVWFNDGSIYGDTNHMKLMIVTSVIVGIFLIPYMLIILTSRLLMKSNKIREYLRPIYEAINAPYKYNKQYWFTARQFLLIFVYIFYTIYRGTNLLLPFSIVLPIYFVFVTVQAYLRPFKNKIINILDLFVMVNYGMLLCTNWYFIISEGHLCTAAVFDGIFVYILMLAFFIVVFYHIVLVTGQQTCFRGYVNVVQKLLKKMTQCLKKNSKPLPDCRHFREEFDSSFFDDSYSEYREPLISP